MKSRAFYFLFMFLGFIGMVLGLTSSGSRWLGDRFTQMSEWCGAKAADLDATLFPMKRPGDGS